MRAASQRKLGKAVFPVLREQTIMESNIQLQTATGLFAIPAIGGSTMTVIRVNGRPQPPIWRALRELLAAAGLILLIYAALTMGVPSMARLATVPLMLAAAGGLVMNLAYRWRFRASCSVDARPCVARCGCLTGDCFFASRTT